MPTVARIALSVRRAHDQHNCFVPAKYLPVNIDPADANPYSLAASVLYANGIVTVKCEKGFQWDGASINSLWVLLPWIGTTVLHHLAAMGCIPSWSAWLITLVLVILTIRIAPYLQKMGTHARAACFHDRMYRLGEVDRAIADAIFMEIMRKDNVRWEARWIIYLSVRCFGWIPYRHWAAVRMANANSEGDGP